MKKTLPIVLLLVLGIASMTYYFGQSKSGYELKAHKGVFIENEVEEQDEPMEAARFEFERTKDPNLNIVPTNRLLEAAEIRDMKLSSQLSGTEGPVPGIAWQERGPNNIGGRTRGLLYDLRDGANGYKKVWSAGVGGGIWYTNDITAGPTWTKVDDFLSNLAVQNIAQNPANPQMFYAGTGEGWFNADAIRGLGIWQSTNGGTNWAQLASTNNNLFYYVQKVVVTSTGVVLASTRDGGVQRSSDNGATFTKVLGAGVSGGITDRAADLEIASNGYIYASLGIFNADGIYRSTDAGLTWTKIYASASDEYRIELATAPAKADIVFALIQNGTTNGIKKIMRTNDTATVPLATWVTKPNPSWCDQGSASADFTRTQAWYDLIAAVDPLDTNTVYIGGVDCHKTTNGGTSWTQITQWAQNCGTIPVVHADIHNFVFRPDAATTQGANAEFLVGCDGGIFRTINGGGAFTPRNTGYNVTQYYGVAMHPTNSNYYLAGAQDNGTHKFTNAGINAVTSASGGDGCLSHIDQNEPNIQITSYTGNQYALSLDGGNTFSNKIFSGGSFVNPTDYDDVANILYGGNSANTYFRWNNPATGGTSSNTVTVSGLATISFVAVSPLTPNRVYFGSSNGTISMVDSANTGTTRTRVITRTGTGNVSCIAIDPSDENHQLVTYSNYGVVSIFESRNATSATATWSSVEGNLPDMPVRWVMFDPRNNDQALIATELGVWSTDDLNSAGVTDWQPTNSGFANVRVDMLQYRKSDRTIAAATHGRGLFTTTVPNVTNAFVNFTAGTATATEATEFTSGGCRYYKDYTVQMSIANPPTGTATITVSVDPSSSAVQGSDFDITTNGNFNTPSNTFTFTAGGGSTQTINVRIYDDAEIETDESFRLTYAISGTSNAERGLDFQTLAFNITSNDAVPLAPTTATYTVGTLNYYIESGSGATTPFDARLQSKRTQILYKAAELRAAGLTKGVINNFQLPINRRSTRPYQNVVIKMGTTTRTTLVENQTFYVIPTTVVKNAFTFTPATNFCNRFKFQYIYF